MKKTTKKWLPLLLVLCLLAGCGALVLPGGVRLSIVLGAAAVVDGGARGREFGCCMGRRGLGLERFVRKPVLDC